ncbi:hypothetical protein [Paraglaciecola sp. 2405UD69-4]|uniref:hypothetical protein n=1 Tax=Paraglaciecola sp. 2405UD69-4 TaxID=3391836 RepID=UPI0039C9475F
MKYLILVAFIFCSCSQTPVHLYTRYLSDTQTQLISAALSKNQFKVIVNDLDIPDSVSQSSVIYSPFIKSPEKVENLTHVMKKLGWEIYSTNMFYKGNHHYKKNSIAFIPIPAGVDPHALSNTQNWAHQYTSQNCDLDLTIELDKSMFYKLTGASVSIEDISQGSWRISQFPYLELIPSTGAWWRYFELRRYTQFDKIGPIEIFELTPLSNLEIFKECKFQYGIRQ